MHRIARLALVCLLAVAARASAQDVVLRLHHFLAESSPVHYDYLVPWSDRVETQSNGRIAVEIYPSMQLGGAPPSLYDQAALGVADLVWTLPGYTPGRFPISEVFELPFMSGRAEDASQAVCAFYREYLREEYAEVRPIALYASGPGTLHVRGEPVRSLADVAGRTIRGPSRVTTDALALLGAEPVGMPVPQVPEALARGVIEGALLPWEVTAPLRVAELVDSHTEFGGGRGLYASTFLFAMNPESYRALPADLREVIDANSMASGCEESRVAGASLDAADARARAAAQERGNPIHRIEADAVRAWREALAPLSDRWARAMDELGLDGDAMLARARELVAIHEAD